eukprot:5450989-Pyramimonas_sp.AAC.1
MYRLCAAHIRSIVEAKAVGASRTEGGPVSTCGSRLSAAHIRFNSLQELRVWRVARFQNVGL